MGINTNYSNYSDYNIPDTTANDSSYEVPDIPTWNSIRADFIKIFDDPTLSPDEKMKHIQTLLEEKFEAPMQTINQNLQNINEKLQTDPSNEKLRAQAANQKDCANGLSYEYENTVKEIAKSLSDLQHSIKQFPERMSKRSDVPPRPFGM